MKNQENILNSWTGSAEKQTVCVCSASSVWVGNCVRVSLTAWVECQMNTSHWHVQSAISSAVVIYELYYMVRVCVCVSKRVCCVWELRLGCCLKWAMGCSAAAAVCMLMLRQSWRTWERRGKGQSTPPQTHIHAQSQPAISHLSWWRIRTGWMCWCVAASLQRIRRIKPTNTD